MKHRHLLFPVLKTLFFHVCFTKVGQESQTLLSCAENRRRGDCETARGLGTTTGRCQWRQGSDKGTFDFCEMASRIYLTNEDVAAILEHVNLTERTRRVIVMIFFPQEYLKTTQRAPRTCGRVQMGYVMQLKAKMRQYARKTAQVRPS